MITSRLYIDAVFYDAVEDEIFEVIIPVNHIDIHFYSEWNKNLDDMKELKFSGRIKNTAQGSILLGSL